MSICTCTPKQKASGRTAVRCTAHSGYSAAKAYAPRKRRAAPPVERDSELADFGHPDVTLAIEPRFEHDR